MKYAAILLGLILCSSVKADQILSGTLTGLPGETVTYDLDITSVFVPQFGGFIEDTISGFATTSGTITSTEIFDPSNLFEFEPTGDQIVLAEFAQFQPNSDPYAPLVLIAKYDFIATGLNQTEIVFTQGADPQVVGTVATPEPETWALLFVMAMSLILGLMLNRSARRRTRRGEQSVPVSHPQRKA